MTNLQSVLLWLPPECLDSNELDYWTNCCMQANGASLDFLEGQISLEEMLDQHQQFGVNIDEFLTNVEEEIEFLGG